MKKTLFLFLLLTGVTRFAYANQEVSPETLISLDSVTLSILEKNFSSQDYSQISSSEDLYLVKVKNDIIHSISPLVHKERHICGGLIQHSDEEEGLRYIQKSDAFKNAPLLEYSLDQRDFLKQALHEIDELSILATIQKLSSFKNRYYKSQHGVDAANWIYNHWKNLTSIRSDIIIEKYSHRNFKQPSIILTVKGSDPSLERVILGGHLDSIAGWWDRANQRAPGADDNASGIAVLSEIIKAVVNTNYTPKRTVQFMGYAGEEAGLLGSKDIASNYNRRGIKIAGVIQFDMTNFQGSSEDIALMTDYTNPAQNQFITSLLDTYFSYTWTTSKCGYACSDHASWHLNGFSASIPFEAKMKDMNPHIHTGRDTLNVSQNNASHAKKFADLGLAYLIELAK